MRDGWRERLGDVIGASWAPAIRAIARARHARMFHPDGQLFDGTATAIPGSAFHDLALRLGPHVLVRFSGALRRAPHESLDVLGIAVRFARAPITSTALEPDDQDLLFATILSPFTMGLSPLTTRSHDYFANDYYAVSPFAIADGRRVKFRLRPVIQPPHRGSRAGDLDRAVDDGAALFELACRTTFAVRWQPIVRFTLDREADLDQRELRFDPFHTGAGIEPVGVIQAIRRRAYPASQSAR
ncbi:MAG: hypothetical protein QM831_34570 [Kofleriaceae bacterium]